MAMREGNFTGFEVELRDPGIAWIKLNTPERIERAAIRLLGAE